MARESFTIVTCPCEEGFRGRDRGKSRSSYKRALLDASSKFLGHLENHSLDMSLIDFDSAEGLQAAIENLSSCMPDVRFQLLRKGKRVLFDTKCLNPSLSSNLT